MTDPTPLGALPAELHTVVEDALRAGTGHEHAIAAIERHLAAGGERTPSILVALATLTYEDAASLMVTRLRQASEEALGLLTEAAERRGASAPELEALRRLFLDTIEREHARDRQLRLRATNPEIATARDLVQLAHDLTMRGEDRLAKDLYRAADDAAELDASALEANEPSGILRLDGAS
ncbi:MAG: hypothetical protein AB7S26_03775 [Sandaracinaceae bacterium]